MKKEVYIVDEKDPGSKAIFEKFIKELQRGNTYYQPFKKEIMEV